jgi:hypothetical protein
MFNVLLKEIAPFWPSYVSDLQSWEGEQFMRVSQFHQSKKKIKPIENMQQSDKVRK